MLTKAHRVRATQQREAHGNPTKKPRRPRRDKPVDTAKPGVSASDRKAGKGATGLRNLSNKAALKGGFELESSATDRPTRKPTRRSGKAHVKSSTQLTGRQTRRTSSPKARATRAQASTR
jgi:hypothetical protein